MFQKKSFAEIKKSVIERLKKAGADLTYHNLAHTLDVTVQAERIASEEKVSEQNKLLLQIAALYHDIGYLDGPQNHEERGCEIFFNEAPQWNFSPAEIKIVQRLIMATKVPQTPKDKLEEIICDADLDYLGRKDFLTLGAGLMQEYLYFKTLKKQSDWDALQIEFLKKHRYFTKSQNKLRKPVKIQNLEKLEISRKITGK